ncbi:cysteine hydrolase family protein [Moraxella cuniculi]|uniref:Isochorismatase family protein yecD n=1 Tax=Moraxella cuniculi TaxID=34061 RepID=A0A3S4SCM2_9GAMM|nr:cysteine hydrolase family protein [Moraxella cuniculi]VEG13172.1 Isochorismatase family protein yecD [Moraxella cuniculi]
MIDNQTALLLIDLQLGFDEVAHWGGNRNNPDCEAVCFDLLTAWRKRQMPIFHIRHASTEPNSPLAPHRSGFAFKPLTAPQAGERIIQKQVNSSFIGTDLQQQLDKAGIKKLVLAGLTTNHCVSTTARMAGNLGYQAWVVHDATATFDRKGHDGTVYPSELIHRTALASLHGEFATVLGSCDVLSMLKNPQNPLKNQQSPL